MTARVCAGRAPCGRCCARSSRLALLACGLWRQRSQRQQRPRHHGQRRPADGTATTVVDTSTCPTGTDTIGVTGDTITIGTSLPQSGSYSAFNAILKGEQAYFDYLNAQGGVEVAGKKYKIKLVDKDDAYDAGEDRHQRAVADQRRQGFALFNVVGTKNNLAIRDTVNTQCVPDLLIASRRGAVGQHRIPVDARLGARSVPARDAGVRRLPEGEEAGRDHRGAARPTTTSASRTRRRSNELVKGTELKIVQTAGVRRRGADVKSQVTSLAATQGRRVRPRRRAARLPGRAQRDGRRGLEPDHLHVGHVRVEDAAHGRRQERRRRAERHAAPRPGRPGNDGNPAMKLYKEQVKKYSARRPTTTGRHRRLRLDDRRVAGEDPRVGRRSSTARR